MLSVVTDDGPVKRSGSRWRRFRKQVLDTYGPVCCFGPACRFPSVAIDLTLPTDDPASYTVHHLDPLSVNATRANLLNLEQARPAHRLCNVGQGNRPMVLSQWTTSTWPRSGSQTNDDQAHDLAL